jgi:hypothetical protein
VYNNKIYNVLNINAEEEDIMKITCILKNIWNYDENSGYWKID